MVEKEIAVVFINLGVADKGEDRELAHAEHQWYNIDNKLVDAIIVKKLLREKSGNK
tara:strand:- start:1897 stop:2064 length:168 start_codon:yes stop_codon:yes gene_type:complete